MNYIKTIIIATPHSRNNNIEKMVSEMFPKYKVLRLKKPEELVSDFLEKINPDWIFFPHWSWIIPKSVYEKYPCVIFHMTDVPYGRGGSPLQNLIIKGHKSTFLSAIRCEKDLDAGPVYLKKFLSLEGTAEEILIRASNLMPEIIKEIVLNNTAPVPQVGPITTFTRRSPKDGNLSVLDTLDGVFDYIRMLDGDGYPPAFVESDNLIIEFKNAVITDGVVKASAEIRVKK